MQLESRFDSCTVDHSPIAQLAEQDAVNIEVPRSSRGGGAREISSVVRAFGLHPNGPRFKSEISH